MKAYPEYKPSGIEWLGNIPSHWNCLKAQYLFSLNSGETINGEDFAVEGQYPVFGGNGIRGYHDNYNLEGEHILVGRVGALCGNIHYTPEKSWVSEHALILTPIKSFNLYWLGELLRIMDLGQYSLASAQPVIAASTIGKLTIPVPSVDEQNKMARYINYCAGKVEELIAEKKNQVEDLRRYRTSLITETVTRGFNPNVPFKKSGLTWLNEIPEHWQTIKMKHCVDISNGSDPKTDGDIPVYGSGASSFKTCGEYKEGPTVLIGRKGATLHIPHWIEGKYWNVDTAFDTKPKTNYDLRFFYYVALIFDYDQYKSQTTLPSMTQSAYENAFIPLPPLSEQKEIAGYLDEKTEKIDDLIAELEKQLEDLALYKKAVITEVVTGKVDVRDWTPNN